MSGRPGAGGDGGGAAPGHGLRPASAGAAPALVPTLAWDPDRLLFYGADQSLAWGFLCEPLSGGDEKTEAKLRSLLEEDWPDDTALQFVLVASPNLVRQFGAVEAARRGLSAAAPPPAAEPLLPRDDDPGAPDGGGGVSEGLLRGATRAGLAFFAAAADAGFEECGGLHLRDFQLAVVAKFPCADARPSDAEVEAAAQLRDRAGATLANIGLAPRPVTADGFVALLGALLNRGADASWRVFGGDPARADVPLNEQVFDRATDLRVDRSGLWLDDARVSVLSAKHMPDALPFGFGAWLVGDAVTGQRGLRGPFHIALTVHFPPVQRERMRLTTKRQWVANAAFGPMQKWLPHLAVQRRDLDALWSSIDDGHRPVRYNLTLVLCSAPADRSAPWDERLRSALAAATAAEGAARTFWSERGVTLMPDRFVALPLFLASLPFCSDRRAMGDTGRFRTCTTEHAARLLPVFADWRGTGTPALLLVGRNGQLMGVDLFDSQTNFNTVVAAQSGAGKSFLANNLIEGCLAAGGFVSVIDAGYSYEKLCAEFGGDFVDFAPERALSLNPFPLVRSYDEEGDILESVVMAMASPSGTLTDLQVAETKRAMREVWAELGPGSSVDAVAARLRADADERVADVGRQLYAFTSEGAYGRYFQGPNTVSFRSRFTVLELDKLQSRKQLQQVVLLMLIYAVQQQMHALPRGTKKIVLIDEAWQLLGDGEVGRFIEHAYRRFRKYNGAAVTVTQSLADFHNSASGRAVLENSANRLLLGQKNEVVDQLAAQGKLALGPFETEVLKSVHTRKGRYSEIFVQTEGGMGVGRLVVPPFSRLLYSTNADDVAAIGRHRARGLTTAAAIEAVLAERDPAARRRPRPPSAAAPPAPPSAVAAE